MKLCSQHIVDGTNQMLKNSFNFFQNAISILNKKSQVNTQHTQNVQLKPQAKLYNLNYLYIVVM